MNLWCFFSSNVSEIVKRIGLKYLHVSVCSKIVSNSPTNNVSSSFYSSLFIQHFVGCWTRTQALGLEWLVCPSYLCVYIARDASTGTTNTKSLCWLNYSLKCFAVTFYCLFGFIITKCLLRPLIHTSIFLFWNCYRGSTVSIKNSQYVVSGISDVLKCITFSAIKHKTKYTLSIVRSWIHLSNILHIVCSMLCFECYAVNETHSKHCWLFYWNMIFCVTSAFVIKIHYGSYSLGALLHFAGFSIWRSHTS